MKLPRTLKYIINLALALAFFAAKAQDQSADPGKRDTTVYAERYGLRVGADISKLVRSAFDSEYQGFELTGDYRISTAFYIAAEIGTEEKTTAEDQYNFSTSGNYIKAGFDYNAYDNWYGMENLIYAGLRYGFGTFSQTLNSYSIHNPDPYWGEGVTPGSDPGLIGEYNGLTAHWLEVVVGIKAELFNNLYLGASLRLNRLLTDTAADRFPNLWIPGFNKVTDDSAFGVGYNYSISYFIPIYKKKHKKMPE